MPGYPDWQRYPSRVGGNLLTGNDVTIPAGTTTYGPFAVSSFDGLSLTILPYSGYGTVKVDWWETEAMANSVKSDTWTVNTNIDLLVTMPAFGPWVTVKIDATATGGMSFVGSARGLGSAGPGFTFPVTSGYLSEYNVTLAASGTVTYPVPFIRSGPAYLTFYPHDTAGKISVSLAVLTPAGGIGDGIAAWGNPTTLVNELFVMTDVACGFFVQNQDTTATHTFDLKAIFT